MKYFIIALMLITTAQAFKVTEIMYNPSDGNEWVEFYTSSELNFSGYELTDNLNTDQIVCCGTCSFNIPSNTHFLVLDQDSTLNFSGHKFCVDDNSIGNSLGNFADRILITRNGNTFVNLTYQKTVLQGNSLSFINDSWKESAPTPGYSLIILNNISNVSIPEVNATINVSVNVSINNSGLNCSIPSASQNFTCNIFNLTKRITNLSIQLDECHSRELFLENETENKNLIITYLQNEIQNLSLRLAALDGCEFNNPKCSINKSCIENNCILKSGCQYNNPSCLAGYICRENECVPEKTVIFRTNIWNGKYYNKQGEIAIDTDKDGKLDCYKYDSFIWFYFSQHPIRLLNTMEGYEVHFFSKKKILIHDNLRNAIYAPSASCIISLSNKSQEGFIGREVIR